MSLNNISTQAPPIPKFRAVKTAQKKSSKVQKIVKKKLTFLLMPPGAIDSKVKKYMCYANKSQKLTPAEKRAIKATKEDSDERKILLSEMRELRRKDLEKRRTKNGLFAQFSKDAVRTSHKYAQQCQRDPIFHTQEEKEGLKRIVENRAILRKNHQKQLIGGRYGSFWAVKDIQRRIKALSDSTSKEVVQTDSGATFSIAGGSRFHFITYEFKKKDGDYYFIIHNRGGGCDFQPLHGQIKFRHDGVLYGKTSVAIKADPKDLADKRFLKALLACQYAKTMAKSQKVIVDHFLNDKNPKGFVVKNEIELICEIENRTPTKEEQKVLWQDPFYHSLQIYGTCTESNLTAAEKDLASPMTRKKIKFSTITQLTSELSSKILILPYNRKFRREILAHKDLRLQQLSDEMLIEKLRMKIAKKQTQIDAMKKVRGNKRKIRKLENDIAQLKDNVTQLGG